MSDTASDLASRAQAREEVARDDLSNLVADNLPQWVYEATNRDDWIEVADAILDPEVFARLAGLLGYVKADGEEFRTFEDGWVGATVRPDGSSEIRSNPATRQRRLVGPWEVVE